MTIIKFNPDSYRGKKYATHVIGLDNLLRDGIVLPPKHHENSANGTVILIKGKPGTGKTTLGLQLLNGLTKSFVLNNDLSFEKDKGTIDKSVFFSIEQEKEELEDKLIDIGISRIFEDHKNKAFSESNYIKKLPSLLSRDIKLLIRNSNKNKTNQISSLIEQFCNKIHNLGEIKENLKQLFFKLNKEQALNFYIKSNEKVSQPADASYNFSPVQKVLDFINEIEDNEIENNRNKYYPCVVLDGLNILTEQEKKVLNLNQIIKTLKKNVFFSILVYDGNIDGDLYQDYLADMVIELRGEERIQPVHYFLHDLQIAKSRFQSAAYGWHQYKIREFGIQVFKSLHFHLHINKYMDNQLSDSFEAIKYNLLTNQDESETDGSIRAYNTNIETILNAPKEGSFTVILGPRGTFKTSLTLNFLYSTEFTPGKKGGEKGDKKEDSLLVSVVDNLGTLHHACQCPTRILTLEDKGEQWRDAKHCKFCHDHFYIFHLRPGCITPDEFFHYLECRIKEHKNIFKKDITRIAFWDLTQLEYRFPLFLSDSMFLPGLIGFGKKNKIAMIVMGAGNSALTPAASAVADNVIFTWRDKRKDDKSEVLAVYIDRYEGKLGQEGKELTYLKINKGDAQAFQLNCPGITPKNVFVNCKESELVNAEDMIQDITNMQGMGGVKSRSDDSTENQNIEETAKVPS